MYLYDAQVQTIWGSPANLYSFANQANLFVNVASQCGLTPQYNGLERLYQTYRGRGFNVLGFPCNQFGGQEPGTEEEIRSFCETRYGVSFPMFEKIEVNGSGRHPLYEELTRTPDASGYSGDVRWNFEKFLVSPAGWVRRFSPEVVPEDQAIVSAIEDALG